MTEERKSELEEISVEAFQTNMQRGKKKKKNENKTNKTTKPEYPRTVGNYKRCNRCLLEIPEGEQRKK